MGRQRTGDFQNDSPSPDCLPVKGGDCHLNVNRSIRGPIAEALESRVTGVCNPQDGFGDPTPAARSRGLIAHVLAR